jgi:hypothetical protein
VKRLHASATGGMRRDVRHVPTICVSKNETVRQNLVAFFAAHDRSLFPTIWMRTNLKEVPAVTSRQIVLQKFYGMIFAGHVS